MKQKKVFVKPVAVAKKFECDDVMDIIFATGSNTSFGTAGPGNASAKQR